ncbi:alpha/beta fold hydrolase [Streptomyces sp. 4N509B]|uniref:alpha/beta fold hydrolase n=1 Tax=Streptomyces sp. 4N509B TaxID=3457413 RepID=UPI003FD38FE5
MSLGLGPVAHRSVEVDGVEIFYREAGHPDAPVLLLPHGYPGSSFVYRHLLPALADRWRLIAPDLPGFGYSGTPSPDDFGYTFDAYADFLFDFTRVMRLERYVIWLHDYGSQFGLRLAMREPRAGGRPGHPERRHLRGRVRTEVQRSAEVLERSRPGVAARHRRAREP